jgi:DNA-binding XRE family transcriptional regulator
LKEEALMDAKKRKKLEELGGRVTTTKEFLGLTDAEAAIVELRLELADALRKRRAAAGLTQTELAKAIGSSQSRVAKMESGDPQASLESLVRALVAAGGKPRLKVA